MEKIIIGKILKPQALKGEVKVKAYTDDLTLFDAGNVLVVNSDNYELTIEKSRIQKGFAYLKFEGFNDIDEVEHLRNKELCILEEDLKDLEENEYYIKDLIGLNVVNENGEILGTIKKIDQFGSADVYTLKHKGNEILFAFVEGLFESVNFDTKTVTVNSKKFEEVMV